MNANTHECDHERIEAFLDSDRFGLEDNDLTEHIGNCANCRAYLESHAADTGTWTDAANMLLLMRENGIIRFFTHAAKPEPRAGDVILSFSPPQPKSAEEMAAKKAGKKQGAQEA